jgi:hypothetical protein
MQIIKKKLSARLRPIGTLPRIEFKVTEEHRKAARQCVRDAVKEKKQLVPATPSPSARHLPDQRPYFYWQACHMTKLSGQPYLPPELVTEILAMEMALIETGLCTPAKVDLRSPLEMIVTRAKNQLLLTSDVNFFTKASTNSAQPDKLLGSIAEYLKGHRSKTFEKLAKELVKSQSDQKRYTTVLDQIIAKAMEKLAR